MTRSRLSLAVGARAAAVRPVGLLACLMACLVVASGCGAATRTSPPSGVDGLQIPNPSPVATQFVSGVDNPWLPLEAGAVWVRRVEGEGGPRTETSRVLDGEVTIAGVGATAVTTAVTTESAGGAGGDGPGELGTSWYAQDLAGNVWLLGQQGVWQAGVDGAEAGLAMPTRPRLGDGFASWSQDGDPRDVVAVGERGESASVPAGRFTDLLMTTAADAGTGASWRIYYAEGVGEVLRQEVLGQEVLGEEVLGSTRVELVSHRPGG